MELEKPLAFNSEERLIPCRDAIPERVSPDFTVYVLAEEELDDEELEELDDELDAVLVEVEDELPDSFSFWPG
ncbi:hypothetical protein [Citricoccus muralis]|uniref:Uncharacterized protein n=1 Tax=Citricoccus muralis TaxID=169134 RepID=A0ABY8H308_9MICC|nr:hypothetical protein [Citricoccus muralis]WFP15518.1 hypothetical protein P8192_08840 [Citricoccus muralis]